jgi:serine/threonine-protein kinase
MDSGEALLHYRLVDKIGEGGMGVVWRATDTALERDVAIKVLPEAFADDAERLARFEREAKLLASLHHPNVATVFGLHESEGVRFIAMELVAGENLADRIARGPLAIGEALEVARGIARGLEAAHEAGVIHRDLKPANVHLTAAGKVKVLDFGLARGTLDTASDGDPHESPTLTSAGTQAGFILGTAGYMSPEQAKGQAADKRADVWAFGAVLYEMLTGSRAFPGDGVTDILAAVLRSDPDFARLPAETPASVRRLLDRCLRKDPDRRLRDIADARLELEEADEEPPPDAKTVLPASGGRSRVSLHLAAAAVAGLILGALLWSFLSGGEAERPADAEPIRRSTVVLPEDHWTGTGQGLALSADGSLLAVVAGRPERPRLLLRRLDSLDSEELPGTEGALSAFFSPDGRWIGFMADGKLKKISLDGGSREVVTLCDVQVGRKASWGEDGQIYFTFGESRLASIPEGGGTMRELGFAGQVFSVQSLPAGRGLLVAIEDSDAGSVRKDTARIAVVDPQADSVRELGLDGYAARYVPNGHLLLMRGSTLFAAPFDLDRSEVTGPAVAVLPGVGSDSIWGVARYEVSREGTLVYVPGGDFARTVPTWIDRADGGTRALPLPEDIYNEFNLSPDRSRLAIQVAGGLGDQVHVYDSGRGTFSRLTESGASYRPVWSHDGRSVYFGSNRSGKNRLYRQSVDGTGAAEPLLTEQQEAAFGSELLWPSSVTPDGRDLLIMVWTFGGSGGDVWRVPLEGSGDPEPLIVTHGNDIIPMISPDGKWLVYLSDRNGPYQIFLRPYPEIERREWQVSSRGGYDARWSPLGDEILYRIGPRGLMSVAVEFGGDGEPRLGVPSLVLDTDFHDSAGSSFDVSADGREFLVNRPVEAVRRGEREIVLVTGWTAELYRLAPPP